MLMIKPVCVRIPIIFILFLGLLGCDGDESAKITLNKHFNNNEFTGLVAMGNAYEEISLDYELDDSGNNSIKFETCPQVEKFDKEKIVTSQYRLFILLQINCTAAKYYFQGNVAKKTYFPAKLTLNTIQNFPADAVAYISKENIASRQNKLLGEYEKNIQVQSVGDESISITTTDGDEISYIVMVRADVDNDTIEDLVIRLDWSILNSFGQGFDLVVLSKTSEDAAIKMVWRYIN